MQSKRFKPAHRRQLILSAALRLAERRGPRSVTRREVAEHAGCTDALVSHYFETVEALQREVMREAVRLAVVPVVAAGLAIGDPAALAAPHRLKDAAGEWLAGRGA